MARRPQHWRLIIGWILTLGIVGYAISDWGSPDEPKDKAISDDVQDTSTLRITALSDSDVNPGDAIVITFAGATPDQPIEVRVAKKATEVVARDESSVVARIPADVPQGKVALRVIQGSTRSKSWDLHVRAPHYKKLLARLLGGIALFVLGLGVLALGMRGLAGDRVRDLLRKLTESPARAVAVGALVGTGTQLTSSSAAFTTSLVETRMLRLPAAAGVLVGAQLGASITGALIPVQLSNESLLIIALGVMWTRVARTRWGVSIANLVLGAGLMLYGLHLLQTSVAPLVSDPKILPFLGQLRSPGVTAFLWCALAGAVLAFVLQGPGPVYVLVVGLAQTTTTLPLANALAITAGANLGAGLGIALIAYAGARTRPLARMHVLFTFAATVLMLVAIPAWTAVATRIVPDVVDYGHSIVRTHIAQQLAVGFIAAQFIPTALWILVLPRSTARLAARAARVVDTTPVAGKLTEALVELRSALAIALETASTGNRRRSAEAEAGLVQARTSLEASYRDIGSEAKEERDVRAIVAGLQLQRATEQALHVAELCVERAVSIGDETKARLKAMHDIAVESFDALLIAISQESPPDTEEAVARELRMNALEAEGRTIAITTRRSRSSSTSSLHIGVAELVDSFENVGNHLFRMTKALAEE